MKITDTTDTPEHVDFLEEVWKKLPKHWQKAMDQAVPDGTEIISPLKIIRRVKKPDVVWVYHTLIQAVQYLTSTGLEDLMAFVRKTENGHQVCCSWRFKVNFVSPDFYFQKHFLRALVIAVYLQREDLRRIVSEESGLPRDSVEAELFFGDTFYKWCIYDRSSDRVQDRYGRALACLDQIDKKFKSLR